MQIAQRPHPISKSLFQTDRTTRVPSHPSCFARVVFSFYSTLFFERRALLGNFPGS